MRCVIRDVETPANIGDWSCTVYIYTQYTV